MVIVGLPDAAVQESRERVQSAIKNAGLYLPAQAPHRQPGAGLGAQRRPRLRPAHRRGRADRRRAARRRRACDGALVVGELSLDGRVRHVRGVLPMAATARQEGFERIFVPQEDAAEAALIPDLEVIPVDSLAALYAHLSGEQPIPAHPPVTARRCCPAVIQTDFREIKGQEHVKRALEVAAAGGHNVLMIGPPGRRQDPAGARHARHPAAHDHRRSAGRHPHLLGGRPAPAGHAAHPATGPFRAPHHTISHAGLVGGGNWPHPGEISLAHRGVLFLDELPEFGPRVLEVMRQPIEDKIVTISRAQGSLTFPANFQLIAAMNPCPCGYYGDPVKPCTCSPAMVTKYQKRISGPLLDRIDIHIEVPRVEYEKLTDDRLGEPSAAIQARVEAARQRQRTRLPVAKYRADGRYRAPRIPRPSPATPTCARRRCASSAAWTIPAAP